jgi:ABC-type Zn uptake system ZnuABC Zn-binding protein ZnuA
MILDKKRRAGVFALLLGVALTGCSRSPGSASLATTPAHSGNAVPAIKTVVATTTTLAALVTPVAGDRVQVHALVPVGTSPETYEPKPHDIVLLEHADLLVENGAGLEAWLTKVISSARSSTLQILVLSDGIPGIGGASSGQFVNPHFWLDPVYAQIYVKEIATALSRTDPAGTAIYVRNAAAEIRRLQALDAWIRGQVATIPPQNRVTITFHDAWYYFDRRYGVRDLGSVVDSPGKEPSAAEFAALIAKAKAYHVRAVFAEPEFSPKLINQLAASANIRTVTSLYDDSLGQTPQLSTYEGMMHYDVQTIVNALKNG